LKEVVFGGRLGLGGNDDGSLFARLVDEFVAEANEQEQPGVPDGRRAVVALPDGQVDFLQGIANGGRAATRWP